jgi:hypothetical protein
MVLTLGTTRAAHAKEADRPFRILDLPRELVQAVFAHFSESHEHILLRVREVCRAFKDHSLVAFGTTFFQHLSAMLHPLSLAVLLKIASHPDLSKFVRKLTISGEEIGGIIVLGGDDEKGLKDLQTSMEHSGLDRMILTDVFRELSGLLVVRINNQSYCWNSEEVGAVRCGSRYIFEGNEDYDLRSEQQEINRAFDVVFACLRNARLAGKVYLEVEAKVMTVASQNNSFFDPTSADWNNDFAVKVQLIELSGQLTPRWALDLLQSATNLRTLEILFADGMFQLSHPNTGLFTWSNLHRLLLEEVDCHGQNLIDFLGTHKETLCDLFLDNVRLITGSWREPLRIMHEMPNLEHLCFWDPYESTLTSQTGDSFDRFSESSDSCIQNFHLDGNAAIRVATGALLFEFRTRSHKYSDLYSVDFRLANAVIDGRAEIRDGYLLE